MSISPVQKPNYNITKKNNPQTERFDTLLDEVAATADLSSPYSISVPLLGASLAQDFPLYLDLLDAIFQSYSIKLTQTPEEIGEKLRDKGSFNAWIFGRILVASQNMGDGDTASKAAAVIQELLRTVKVDDEFSTWAAAYLTIYYAKESGPLYEEAQADLLKRLSALESDPQQQQKDNVIWALVLGLQSASIAQDRDAYNRFLAEISNYYGKPVVKALLEDIPPEDFRGWAMSAVLEAARRMGDADLVSALEPLLAKQIDASPSPGDQMLALGLSRDSAL